MEPRTAASGTTRRGLAMMALAIAGLLASLTPWCERFDAQLLDVQWRLLRKFSLHPAPDDIIVVGVDEETVRRIKEPAGLWHQPLGFALARIAAARPAAVGLALPLPERSYDEVRPGSDRALLLGLAAARDNGPLVATLSIDPRTRGARPVHPPFLALLQEERLGLGLLAREADGVTRRFSLAIPTEDGAFPTLTGRLCSALKRPCGDGFLHFALGPPFKYVPLHQVLETADAALLERTFRNRIVLLGETLRHADRIDVPVSFAGWEEPWRRDAPAVVVQALALRTALQDAAPQETSRPWAVLLAALAASLVLLRDWRVATAAAALAGAALLGAGTLALRGGLVLSLGAPMLVVALAWAVVVAIALARRYEIRRR